MSGSVRVKRFCPICIPNFRIISSCECEHRRRTRSLMERFETIVLLLQNLNKNRSSIFETTDTLNNGQNRFKPLVISQCYNSLWLDTITL